MEGEKWGKYPNLRGLLDSPHTNSQNSIFYMYIR
jgi:hypothetical protein